MIAALVIILVALGIVAVYTLTLYNTLTTLTPANRTMKPGMVWLLLVPCLNIFWHFVVVQKLSDSIAKEFRQRTGQSDYKPGYGLGMIASSAFALSTFLNFVPSSTPVDILGGLFALVGMVCGIIYWVQIAKYKNRIKQLPPYITDSLIFSQPNP